MVFCYFVSLMSFFVGMDIVFLSCGVVMVILIVRIELMKLIVLLSVLRKCVGLYSFDVFLLICVF